MTRIYVFLLFLFLTVHSSYGQSDFTFTLNKEGKLIALPKRVNFDFNIPEFSYKSYTPASNRIANELLKNYKPVVNPKLDERPMDMEIMSRAYFPFFNEYAPMLKRISPVAFDFREVEYFPLNENLSFVVSGTQASWPGLGGHTFINPALTWQSGPWQITGSGFAGRYFTPFNQSTDFFAGTNLHTSFQATDWMKFNAWGQYVGYNNKERKNPHLVMSPFFHHNSIGSSVEFKLNQNFSVGAGMQYEFNPIRNKWERQFLIFPVFH